MSVVLADKVADAGATGTKWFGVHNYKVLLPLFLICKRDLMVSLMFDFWKAKSLVPLTHG